MFEKCCVCGSSNAKFFRNFKPKNTSLDRVIFSKTTIVECLECGHRFSRPMPPEYILENYYESFYWSDHRDVREFSPPPGPPAQWTDARAIGQNEFCSHFLESTFSSERLIKCVDIGAGGALSVRRLSSLMDVEIYAIEPSEIYHAYYDENGVILLGEKISDLRTEEHRAKYHFVSASHVLEHVVEPAEFVSLSLDLLKPGGFIFLEVPNCNQDWNDSVEFDSPHLHFFNVASLRALLERIGFTVRAVVETGLLHSEAVRLTSGVMSRDEMLEISALGARNEHRDQGGWLRILGSKSV